MPPPLPSALLKSVTFLPRHPHHLPPPARTPPFVYGASHRKPSRVDPVPASGHGNPGSSAVSSVIFTRKEVHHIAVALAARSPGEERWWRRMRPNASGEGSSAAARRWVAGGPGLGGGGKDGEGGEAGKMKVVGSASLRQFPKGEGEVEVNARCGGERKQQQHDSGRLLTIPTVLTLGRIAAVPLLVCTFYMDGSWATTATTSIFLAAAVTDWLDGYIARKMRLGTAFGAFLDPVADKLMVAATLVLLCSRPLEVTIFGNLPWLLTVPSIAIIGREITMSAVREWAASQDSKVIEAVTVNNLGKWKTATQMTALTILLATRDPSLSGPGLLVASGVVLLYISAGLALWSLHVYTRNIWRFLL